MLLALIGVLTAFNLWVFKLKFEQGRWGDLALDLVAFSFLMMFFGHTLGGLVISVIAGTIISVSLYIWPPN